MVKRGGGTIANFFKMGFGAGLGVFLAQIIFVAIGAAFFIPGYMMLLKERKKPEEDRGLVMPYILMVIGTVLGFGGAGTLLSNMATNFE